MNGLPDLTTASDRLQNLEALLLSADRAHKSRKWWRATMQVLAAALSSASGGMSALLTTFGNTAVGVGTTVGAEDEQGYKAELFRACLVEQSQVLRGVIRLVMDIMIRVEVENERTEKRVESPEFLEIVRRLFRDRESYENATKREYSRRLLTHAANPSAQPDPDDLFKLFVDWLARYNELHFRVLAIVRQQQPCTRLEIWQELHGEVVKESSAEADLFSNLILDLTFGHMIRKERTQDRDGRFLKAPRSRRQGTAYMKSRFDDSDNLIVTELGERFIHYVMDELVPKLADQSTNP